jgi:transcriptional regulator with XRE-family HTH domain
MTKSFGEFFKELRIKKELTLRKYCEKYDLDTAQISRTERGLLPAPKVKEKIKFYAETLGLK